MMHSRLVLYISVALHCVGAPVAAQAPEACAYDACALRLRHSFLSVQLVQGQDERPVASLGWFAPAVPLFAERSDTAARYYASFRRRQTSGTLLSLAGVAALTAGLLACDSDDDVAIGLTIGGGLLNLGGGIQLARAREPLSQAIWWYNRTLAAAP